MKIRAFIGTLLKIPEKNFSGSLCIGTYSYIQFSILGTPKIIVKKNGKSES